MNFFMKMMLKNKLKGVPGASDADVDKLLEAIEKNPDFFKNLAEKVQGKMSAGMSQEEAVLSVIKDDGGELKSMLGK